MTTAGAVTVLTDDERPFVIYGEAERKARKSQRRAGRMIDTLLEPFTYQYMVNAMWAWP
jgi:hypothetical protein